MVRLTRSATILVAFLPLIDSCQVTSSKMSVLRSLVGSPDLPSSCGLRPR